MELVKENKDVQGKTPRASQNLARENIFDPA